VKLVQFFSLSGFFISDDRIIPGHQEILLQWLIISSSWRYHDDRYVEPAEPGKTAPYTGRYDGWDYPGIPDHHLYY
jgi:hypothetical protein